MLVPRRACSVGLRFWPSIPRFTVSAAWSVGARTYAADPGPPTLENELTLASRGEDVPAAAPRQPASASVASVAGSTDPGAALAESLDVLSSGLVALAAEGFPVTRAAPAALARRRGRRGASAVEAGVRTPAPSFIDTTAMLAQTPDPTAGMVARQQDAFREQLSEDRALLWQAGQRDMAARLAASRRGASEVASPVDDLRPAVVQGIVDEVATATGGVLDLAAKRKERVRDSFALILEQLLTGHATSGAYAGARVTRASASPSGCLRVLGVDDDDTARLGALGSRLRVTVRAPAGEDAAALQARLNTTAPDISAALARRMLTALVPQLRFEVAVEGAERGVDGGRGANNRLTRRRTRHTTVHAASRSWTSNMEWR